MTETRTLLGKIATLRQRLDQAQKLASEATSAAATLLEGSSPSPFAILQRKADVGAEHDIVLDGVVGVVVPPQSPTLPKQLTMRARRASSSAGASC